MPVRVHPTTGVRLGTADEAGKLCITPRKTRGVDRETFRKMPKQVPGCPSAYIDPDTGMPSRSPVTGEQEWDLDAVEAFNAGRRGPRGWSPADKRTDYRHDLMREVAAGRILSADTEGGFVRSDGRPLRSSPKIRAINLWIEQGVMHRPAEAGVGATRLEFSPDGAALLQRWEAEAG